MHGQDAVTAASLELVILASDVRFGTRADSPELLGRYLERCSDFARSLPLLQQREHWETVFELLMETYCDSAVASSWRRLCVNNVHRPLGELTLLSQLDGEVTVLRRCLSMLKSYTEYLPSAFAMAPSEMKVKFCEQRPSGGS